MNNRSLKYWHKCESCHRKYHLANEINRSVYQSAFAEVNQINLHAFSVNEILAFENRKWNVLVDIERCWRICRRHVSISGNQLDDIFPLRKDGQPLVAGTVLQNMSPLNALSRQRNRDRTTLSRRISDREINHASAPDSNVS